MTRSTTLFRYADVRRPRVYDLKRRVDGIEGLADIIDNPEENIEWARGVLDEKAGPVLERVSVTFREQFGHDPLARGRLPTTEELAEAKQPVDRLDWQNLVEIAVAAKLAGDPDAADLAGRWLQVIEAASDPSAKGLGRPFAPPVLAGFSAGKQTSVPEAAPLIPAKLTKTVASPSRVAKDVAFLWRVRNQMLAARRDASRQAETVARGERFNTPMRVVEPSQESQQSSSELADAFLAPVDRTAAARARVAEARARRSAAAESRRADAQDEVNIGMNVLLSMSADDVITHVPWVKAEEVKDAQDRLKESDVLKDDLNPQDALAFCRIYDSVAEVEDAEPQGGRGTGFLEAAAKAFRDAMTGALDNALPEPLTPGFGDDVRLLGIARLIKVEEHLMGYSEGEIARIENVLAGEKRVSERKTLREFELVEEDSTEEVSSTSSETATTTTSELSSQVERELATRFSTDVSASASGGGGGSVGVVNFEGEGSVEAGANFGLDVSTRSSTESNLGREIVEATAEQLSKITRSSRVSRTRTLHESLERLEVDNSGAEAEHRRGVYCFLDKHVCVTETPYGLRWFLRATVAMPGRDLMVTRLARLALGDAGNERPPEFNLSPEMITPGNYLQLAGLYKAQGLPVPPPPSRRLSRVYKAEQSNETTSDPKGLEGIGKALMPVMKSYKRHLVTDVIQVPEDYEVQEVRIALCHGANGMSVPVDLPLKLVSAGVMTAPIALSYTPFGLPAALWNVLMLASPLVNHNTDSSFVTATVGVEAKESKYYYFDADELTDALLTLLGGLQTIGPMVLGQIKTLATTMHESLEENAEALVTMFTTMIGSIAGAAEKVFDSVGNQISGIQSPADVDLTEIVKTLLRAFRTYATTTQDALKAAPDELFEPLETFIEEVEVIIEDAAESFLGDLMDSLQIGAENNDLLIYGAAAGLRGELPVNLNICCLKPGVTANLSACLIRTEMALDRWRLDVFSALHQSWLQQVADYEGRQFLGAPTTPTNPAMLRAEERLALKTRTIETLRRLPGGSPAAPSANELALFEHGIDWENMSHRTYRYGTGTEELLFEHLGAFRGTDRARREFLTATWAELMLPLSPNDELERSMLAWFDGGNATIGADLENDELATLWSDVVSGRAQLEEQTGEAISRELVLPTDYIALRTEPGYPSNSDTACQTPD